MTARYRLARSARRDIEKISDYWTEEAGQAVALRILTEILDTAILLAVFPRVGVAAKQLGPGVRKFPVRNYLIYYRSNRSKGIEILHVFHGARDQRKAWEDKAAT